MKRKRYAVVGLGSRSHMFTSALLTDHRQHGELAAYCDPNAVRMNYYNRLYAETLGAPAVPTYRPQDFGRMLTECAVDAVIVTSPDRTHHRYIIAALEAGRDVITEKPMTVDAERCQAILDAQRRSGRELRVSFNYRYAPRNAKVRELLASGVIGRVLSVHFEWLLDTRHGADYFRRWHRDKRNSGGLMVHKATHHFDLLNWWLGARPQTVFGLGRLAFYGRENAEARGVTALYDRAYGRANAQGDPFALHLDRDPWLRALYLDAEGEDGYLRDQSVFGDGISIEDDMALLVRYDTGASLSYHLHAYAPWEGYRVMFNGAAGRLEVEVVENAYVSGAADDFNRPDLRALEPPSKPQIVLHRLWSRPLAVEVEEEGGGHGGGDARLLADLFGPPGAPDPLGRAAGPLDGAWSILTGIAANRSFQTGLPVNVSELIRW